MRIKLNNTELNKLNHLLETKYNNIEVASMLNELCFSLDTFDELNEVNDSNVVSSINEAIFDYFELNDQDEFNLYIRDEYFSHSFHLVNLEEYQNNPYKKLVNIKEINQNGYKLHYLSYPKYSFFPLDDIKVEESNYYKEISSIGFSKEEYKYLTLSKNNNIWMCITPNEINTMKPHLENAKGNVVTFGLGLGYFAFMASNKKEVKKVTIIERDQDIINLFKSHLLPHFPHKEKIELIHIDAFEYIKRNGLKDYQYAFFDLWHNAEDGLPLYINCLRSNIFCPTGYWIEESLISMYRRCFLTVVEESLQGYTDDSYRKARNDIDRIINEIYFQTKNISFNTYDEIAKFISKDNLKKFIAK